MRIDKVVVKAALRRQRQRKLSEGIGKEDRQELQRYVAQAEEYWETACGLAEISPSVAMEVIRENLSFDPITDKKSLLLWWVRVFVDDTSKAAEKGNLIEVRNCCERVEDRYNHLRAALLG